MNRKLCTCRPRYYTRAAGNLQEKFACSEKKENRPGEKLINPRAAQHFLLNSTLHSLRHDARRVNLPQNPRRAYYHGKANDDCTIYPDFSLFPSEKMHFFSEKCKI